MAFVLIWLAVLTVLGSILTIDAPFWPRLVGIVPAAALLIALTFEQILELGRRVFGSHGARFILAFMCVFLAMVGYLDWNQYYLFVKDSGSPSTFTGRYIGRLPEDVTACGIITGPQLTVRETSFLAWPHKLVDIAPDAPDSELDKCIGSSIVWAISPENVGRLDAVRARWPNGILDERFMPRFNYTMTFYLVGVQPPDFESEEPSNLPPSILNGISIIVPFVLAGIFVWFFFRSAPQKIPRERQFKKMDDSHPAPKPDLSRPNSTRSIFAGLTQWYDEVKSFTFPAVTPRLIASLLLPLVAVGLAYFAQTFLDQSANVGLHLRVEALYFDTEGRRLGVAALIFVIAALLWTFTTSVRENNSSNRQISQGKSILQPAMGSPVQIAGIFFTVSAILLYAVMDETSLVRWLWLAGLGLFIASLFVKSQLDVQVLRDESPAFRWVHVLVLASLLVLAFALRVYRLYDIPLDLSTDMASVGINARDYLFGVENRIFGTGWYYMPRITFIPYMASMAVAGNNLFGFILPPSSWGP